MMQLPLGLVKVRASIVLRGCEKIVIDCLRITSASRLTASKLARHVVTAACAAATPACLHEHEALTELERSEAAIAYTASRLACTTLRLASLNED